MDSVAEGEHINITHNVDNTPAVEGYHSHDRYEVLFVLSGKVEIATDVYVKVLGPYDILLLPPKTKHRIATMEKCVYERKIVYIKPEYIESFAKREAPLSPCLVESKKNGCLLHPDRETAENILRLIARIELTCVQPGYGTEILERAYIMELLAYLNRAFVSGREIDVASSTGSELRMTRVIIHIQENLRNLLSIKSISEEFFISRYYLCHEFKKYTGQSIHKYILEQRLKTAEELLSRGVSVNDAYVHSGFANYINFSKAFKCHYGLAPREYIKNINLKA